jgi:glycerol-3-phosphate dehydrogenase (NAD(P)+)
MMLTSVRPIERIAVAGAGSWGTTIANLLAGNGFAVRLWAREPELVDCVRRTRQNSRYLPGITLHPGLEMAETIEQSLDGADLAVLAIPAQSLRAVVQQARAAIRDDVVLVNLAKGIEAGTGTRCSEILFQELKQANPVAALSGPNIAWEVVRGVPSKAVVACSNYRYLDVLREVFSTPCFKVYESPDLAGTELGGALKNVIAIMAGIGDGLGYGVNTKSAVITRGLAEMVRLGVIMGGHRETFFGLSGIGDLMATSLSEHSRNRTLGEHIGRGAALADAEAALNGRVAEGVKTTKALFEIKSSFRVEMPIVDTLHAILFEGLPPREGYFAIWSSRERFEAD